MGNGIPGIQGTECRECRECRKCLLGFLGNLLEDSGEFYYFKIPRNVEEYSGECSRTFRGMFKKIPGNEC